MVTIFYTSRTMPIDKLSVVISFRRYYFFRNNVIAFGRWRYWADLNA